MKRRKVIQDEKTKEWYLVEKQMLFIGKFYWVIISRSFKREDLETSIK